MQGAHGEMVGLLPPVGLPSKKLPEPTPMYHDEGGGAQKRDTAHAMEAKEAIPFRH